MNREADSERAKRAAERRANAAQIGEVVVLGQYLTLTAKLEVPPDLSALKLKDLTVKGKTVKRIAGLPSTLESVQLSGNKLESLPDMSKLATLETIDVSTNNLTALPSELWELSKLRSVSATTNRIEKVGEHVQQATSLGSLHLDKNPKIDVQGLTSSSLRILSLRNCKLSKLSLGKLPKLVNLSLGMNPFGEFPSAILEFNTLTHLYLWGCKVSTVPDDIASLKNLIVLELEKNTLSALPSKLPPKLSTLLLEKNRFEEFPPGIFSLNELTNLNVSHNTIDILPQEIAHLTKLQTLKIEGHPLTKFPSDLSPMKELKTFYLQGDADTHALMNSQVEKLPPQAFIMMWEQGNRARDVARDGNWV